MNLLLKVSLMLSFIILYGCVSPEVKFYGTEIDKGSTFIDGSLPLGTDITVNGIYISSKCFDKQLGFIGGLGSGKYTTLVKNKYQSYKPDIQYDKVTGEFTTQLPNNGGSSCDWGLSKILITLKISGIDNNYNDSIFQDIEVFGNSKSSLELAKKSGKKIFYGKIKNNEIYYKFIKTSVILNKHNESWVSDEFPNPQYVLITEGKDVKISFSPKIDYDYIVRYSAERDPKTGKAVLKTVYPNGEVIEGKAAQKLLRYKFYESKSQR